MAGRSGPRTQPTALKVLKGNPGKRPLPQGEPHPDAPTSLEPPPELDEGAREFWRVFAPKLERLGLLTELDLTEFATACQLHSLFQRLIGRVQKTPFGKKAPEYQRRAQGALADRDRILSRFGFDPSSRAKLSVKPPEEVDPFEELLRKRQAR